MVKYSTHEKKKSIDSQTYISNCNRTNHATQNPAKRWSETAITESCKKFKELKKMFVKV